MCGSVTEAAVLPCNVDEEIESDLVFVPYRYFVQRQGSVRGARHVDLAKQALGPGEGARLPVPSFARAARARAGTPLDSLASSVSVGLFPRARSDVPASGARRDH